MTYRLARSVMAAAAIALTCSAPGADEGRDTRARDDAYIRRQQDFAAGRASRGVQDQPRVPVREDPPDPDRKGREGLREPGATARTPDSRPPVDDLWSVNWTARRCDPSVNTLDQAREAMGRMCQSLGPAQKTTDEVRSVVRFVCAKRPYPFGPVAWLAHGRAACEAKLAYLRLAYPLADGSSSVGARSGSESAPPARRDKTTGGADQDEEDATEH